MITPEIEIKIKSKLDELLKGTLTLDQLTKFVFDDPNIDGRSVKGRELKQWLIENSVAFKTSGARASESKAETANFELEKEQKEFIEANIEKMRPMEMARILWPKKKISPLNREFRSLQEYIVEIRPDAIADSDKSAGEAYVPPQSIYRLVPKINSYITRYKLENIKPLPINEKLIPEAELKNLRSVLNYLNTDTFVLSINIYELVQERELFESKFIRYVYDKPDLTEEEVDQYILICDKSVSLHQIRRNIQTLQKEINTNLESGDVEKKKVAMSFIELLNAYRAKESDAESVLDKTIKGLVGTREKRLQGRLQNNATVMNLVTAWQDEEKRRQLLALAEKQREAQREAVDKLHNMDAVVSLIAGFDANQAKYGP